MDGYGNTGFIYSLLCFSFLSLFIGIIRSVIKKIILWIFKIIEADENYIDQIGELFDLYRQFYEYKSDILKSTSYIKDRIINNESKYF